MAGTYHIYDNCSSALGLHYNMECFCTGIVIMLEVLTFAYLWLNLLILELSRLQLLLFYLKYNLVLITVRLLKFRWAFDDFLFEETIQM
jgi:hypothetical protein